MTQIALSGRKNAGSAFVDDADAAMVLRHRWHLHTYGYATTAIKGADGRWHTVSMHRLILGLPFIGSKGAPRSGVVDHIDGDPLNNRRSNLRVVTTSENRANEHPAPTGVRGVYRRGAYFVARVQIGSARKAKSFRTLRDADAWVRANRTSDVVDGVTL